MKAHLTVTHIGFSSELELRANSSYAQEFITEELGLQNTGTNVNRMICSGTKAAAEVLSRAIAEGFTVGYWEPLGVSVRA